MHIIPDMKLDYKDVLLRPKRSKLSSRSQVDLNRTFIFPHTQKKWTGIPIIGANMSSVATFTMATALAEHSCMTALHKHYDADDLVTYYQLASKHTLNNVFYSIGIVDSDLEKLTYVSNELTKKGLPTPDKICIDVANGYSENFLNFVKRFRDANPEKIIMAGNVVTGDITEELILSGVDIVKVGIGPGSVCTTRKMTGIGFPQLSSIIECADAAHGLKGLVCGDGGLTVPGDFGKGFAAGADFLMVGGMFAGHDECNGQITTRRFLTNELDENGTQIIEERKFVKFFGMSSKEAQEKHNGGTRDYRASEGKAVEVPYRGSVQSTIMEILGSLRSTCTYIGAEKLKEISKRGTFLMVSQQKNDIFGKE